VFSRHTFALTEYVAATIVIFRSTVFVCLVEYKLVHMEHAVGYESNSLVNS
jgi:hypothetical protein